MNKGLQKRTVCFLIALALAFTAAVGAGCSSGSSSSAQNQAPKEETIAGYSIAEYNADVATLEQLLADARGYYDAMNEMGDPNNFSSQEQVDEYNGYVDQYNQAADAYNSAADAFGKKYGTTIDGMGSRGTDPYNIDVPKRK